MTRIYILDEKDHRTGSKFTRSRIELPRSRTGQAEEADLDPKMNASNKTSKAYRRTIYFFSQATFHRVSPSFTDFHRVSPSFTEFHQVSPTFTEFHQVSPSFTKFHRVSPSFTEFHRVSPSFTEFHRVSPSFGRGVYMHVYLYIAQWNLSSLT